MSRGCEPTGMGGANPVQGAPPVQRIVVLGAGYAGLTTARRLVRRAPPKQTRVTLVNRSPHFVERIRLHQVASGQRMVPPPIDLPDLVVGTVIGLDLTHRQVQLGERCINYDILVYALGSDADRDTIPGVRDHANTLADLEEASRLAVRLDRLPPRSSVAVVGGGLTGIEAATEIASARPDLRVTLLSSGPVGGWLSPRVQRHLTKAFHQLGVAVNNDIVVTAVNKDSVTAADGSLVPADVVVWAAGFAVSRLARQAGLAVDERGRIRVDDHLRSVSHPEVYAVGDAATLNTAAVGSRMSCQTSLPMGAHAARNILRQLQGRPTTRVRIRYVWQNISLGRRDAITQFTRFDDTPLPLAWTGCLAAAFKEAISRSAAWTAYR